MGKRNRCGLAFIAAVAASMAAATAHASVIDITMTGTLSGHDAGFPWGFASNTIPATTFYSVDGDPFTAHFRFDTGVGTISQAGGVTTLSGPTTIASGDVQVAGHDFAVPSCVFAPCTTTTTALYSRGADFIKVLFYEDASASAGLVLQASALGSWGSQLSDPIPTQAVTSQGIDIVLQPPDSYYTLAAFADVTGVTVTAGVPEPAAWSMMLLGFGGAGAAMRRMRRKNGRALAAA